MAELPLAGKTALVTGGSGGIGSVTALALAEGGADVAVLDRQSVDQIEPVAEAIRRLGRAGIAVQQDIAQIHALPELVERIIGELGKIDILVNSAAIAELVPVQDVSIETMELTLRINAVAPFFLSQAVAKHLIQRAQGGRIINITSTNGLVAEALLAPYNASKGALEMLTKSMAIELGPYGISVNSVAPGLIETDIGAGFPLNEKFWDYARQHIPLGKLGRPDDVAGAVVFLASEAGAYITGQHIVVDGGLIAEQFPRMQFYTGSR